jgi:hypothetical protein
MILSAWCRFKELKPFPQWLLSHDFHRDYDWQMLYPVDLLDLPHKMPVESRKIAVVESSFLGSITFCPGLFEMVSPDHCSTRKPSLGLKRY